MRAAAMFSPTVHPNLKASGMPLSTDPVISVLTPAYNASRFLPALIESVHSQDYPHFEHIIIDDGSCDDDQTVAILKQYPHLKWHSQPNKGQYHTQNELLSLASGDYVTFICADDLYTNSGAISSIVARIRLHPGVDVVFGKTPRLVDYAPKLAYRPDLSGHLAQRIVRYWLAVQHCSLFVRRGLLLQEGLLFDASYSMCGDWDWIIRLFHKPISIEYVPQDVAYWRMHDCQTSQVSQIHGQEEIRRLCSVHGTPYAIHKLCARIAAYYAFVRYAVAIYSEYGSRELYKKVAKRLLTAQ
jgi:glycosyltransferase involved in cell wall biosynthesis